MNHFNIVIAILGSLLIPSQAIVSKPDAVLANISALEAEVFEYQASVQIQVRNLRTSGGQISSDLFNKTLTIIQNNIKNISTSDEEISSKLTSLNQNACIKNLVNTVAQVVELSGYAISNCIDYQNATSLNSTNDLSSLRLLDSVEREINYLAAIIVNAFIGRNIFTEGDAIVDRVQEQLNATRTEVEETLSEIKENSGNFTATWDEEIKELQTCFDRIDQSIQSALTTVEAQIPICTMFGGRGARSAVINPRSFFPQLNQ